MHCTKSYSKTKRKREAIPQERGALPKNGLAEAHGVDPGFSPREYEGAGKKQTSKWSKTRKKTCSAPAKTTILGGSKIGTSFRREGDNGGETRGENDSSRKPGSSSSQRQMPTSLSKFNVGKRGCRPTKKGPSSKSRLVCGKKIQKMGLQKQTGCGA